MLTRKSLIAGFTIVELLVVIIVISILVVVGVIAYNGVTARGSDAERQTDILNVSKALAQYRILNMHYPRYDDIANNNLVWIKANLNGIQPDAFVAPGGTDANSYGNSTGPALNAYSYRPYFDDSDGVARVCTQSNLTTYLKTVENCARYELRWRSQQTNAVTTMKSRWGWNN